MLDVSLSMMSKETGKNLLQHRDMMSKGMCGCEGDSSSIYLPFSTLYVFTFSDLNNWDPNLGKL